MNTLKSTDNVKEASDMVPTDFERPKGQGEKAKEFRSSWAQLYYNRHAPEA